jgi:hypothetical protein
MKIDQFGLERSLLWCSLHCGPVELDEFLEPSPRPGWVREAEVVDKMDIVDLCVPSFRRRDLAVSEGLEWKHSLLCR